MSAKLQVAMLQFDPVWENPQANRSFIEQKVAHLQQHIDLIVLPEMFTTGFSLSPETIAETMDGESVQWMKTLARQQNCAITGSLAISEDGLFYNRLLFVLPSGQISHYDKRHLFSLAAEDKTYTSGELRLIIEYKGFKICPLICYDLRFPVFSRNNENYDLLLYVASWPQTRITAWDSLLKARAIENLSYVIGVNRVGEDPNQNEYPGHSQALDYLGEFLVSAWENEGVFVVELDKEKLHKAREKFGFLNDQDGFTVG